MRLIKPKPKVALRRLVSLGPPNLELGNQAECALDELMSNFPLAIRPDLVWRNLRVTAGMAYPIENQIALSRILLVDEARMVSTLKHEYAHLMAYATAGRAGIGHGAPWVAAMTILEELPIVRHRYDVQRNQVRQQVLYRCQKCGFEFHKSRRFARNRIYVHRQCGGRFLLIDHKSTAPSSD